jgi:hypothetical protein
VQVVQTALLAFVGATRALLARTFVRLPAGMQWERTMKALVAFAAMLIVAGCGNETSSGATAAPVADDASALPANGAFVARAWVSADPGRPRGTLLIFLPNRTLLMDSCFETYRMVEWGVAGDNIRWREDTIPLEASVSMPRANELELRIVGQDEAQHYIAASTPYLCPDMPK